MSFASRIVLHSPVSDVALLDDFVERCLIDKVRLIAIVGPGCALLEDLIDEIIVGDGSDPDRDICTTSHPGELLEDVLAFAGIWNEGPAGDVQEVVL